MKAGRHIFIFAAAGLVALALPMASIRADNVENIALRPSVDGTSAIDEPPPAATPATGKTEDIQTSSSRMKRAWPHIIIIALSLGAFGSYLIYDLKKRKRKRRRRRRSAQKKVAD